MKTVLYLIVCTFVLSACSTPRVGERAGQDCDHPKTVQELLTCAGRFGTVTTYEVKSATALNDSSGSCPGFEAWNDGDTVLVVTYGDTTTFWRVANVQPDYGTWVQGANPLAEGWSKAHVIATYALPNCAGTGSAWWANCSFEKNCDCPCTERMPPDSVMKYVEKVVVPPPAKMLFGVAGANKWGPGGGLQWKLSQSVTNFIVQVMDWK